MIKGITEFGQSFNSCIVLRKSLSFVNFNPDNQLTNLLTFYLQCIWGLSLSDKLSYLIGVKRFSRELKLKKKLTHAARIIEWPLISMFVIAGSNNSALFLDDLSVSREFGVSQPWNRSNACYKEPITLFCFLLSRLYFFLQTNWQPDKSGIRLHPARDWKYEQVLAQCKSWYR